MIGASDWFESIPQMMKTSKRWLLWRSEERNGKSTKVPYSISGSKASVNDPATWTTFEQAVTALDSQENAFSGLGFVLGDGYLGIDIDDCLSDEQKPNALAIQIVEAVNSFTEISPSGRGLHVIARGSLPVGPRRTRVGECRLEMYDAARYFTVTGQVFDSRFGLLTDAQDAIDQIYRHHFEPEISPKIDVSESALGDTQTFSAAYVLNQFEKLPNSESAKALFNGDDSAYGDDTSAADLAFCNIAKQVLGPDAAAIDSAYRASSRYRSKWDTIHAADGKTYGTMTVQKALQSNDSDRYAVDSPDPSRSYLKLIPATDVRHKAIDWFMPGRIPRGELVLFEGDGGIGKTTVALDIIARATRGRPLPDGSTLGSPLRALILAEEDSLSTLKARLIAAEADLARIAFVEYAVLFGAQGRFVLPDHIGLLQSALEQSKADLFYLDALFSHFNSKLRAVSYQDSRAVLAPVANVAHITGTTMMATRHWGKMTGTASGRGFGSADVRNISRATLTFGRHPHREDVPPIYVLAVSKSNYSRQSTDSLLYQVESEILIDDDGKPEDVPKIRWLGTDSTTADDLASRVSKFSSDRPFERACETIKRVLVNTKDGLSADELESERVTARVTKGTWVNARSHLHKLGKIERSGGGQAGPVRWALVRDDTASDSHIA
jgi:hypothetical protein